MTLRKPHQLTKTRKVRSSRADRIRRRERQAKRSSLLETLESRQLLAGPELVGIQPNEGSLLNEGTVLSVSPREIVFRFDDSTEIDPDTLDAIRITRSGEDRVFESASASSDLGTNGQVLLEFRAAQSGSIGNGVVVNFVSSSRFGNAAPILTTGDRSVTIDLNNNPASPTRVQDLISAVANDPLASQVIEVIQVSGPSLAVVGTTVQSGSSLTLLGANSAEAITDFGTNGAVRVRLISQRPGFAGRGTIVQVEQRNFGGPANPVVVVNDQSIRVQLNSAVGFETTAEDFINALNNNPDASELVLATLQQGDITTPIGNQPTAYSPLTLSGVSDVVVEPGFIGLGDSSREVVFRFAEPLPDDIYQLDILGSGPFALRNINGEFFQDGDDLTRTFSINLGPKVVAVVPEPVRRGADGSLNPDIGRIEVHFNGDDLDPATAEDPRFYQLIFTRDTASTLGDGTVLQRDVQETPNSVSYNNITNIATLDFGRPLSRFIDADGSFIQGAARLRVGLDDALPAAPKQIVVAEDPADSFALAQSIDLVDPGSQSSTLSALLSSEIFNPAPYDLNLPGPDVPGTRDIRPDDPTRLTRPIPLDYIRGGADSIDGISVIQYDFAASFLGDDPSRPGIVNDTRYFNHISEQQKQRVREAFELFSQYLGVNFEEVEGEPTSAAFFSIVVGDLYAGNPGATSGQGGQAVVTADRNGDGIDDLGVLDFQDFDESIDDQFGDEFFRGAMFIIGQLLGYGYADDLPQPVTQSSDFIFQPGGDTEASFPSVADIVHGQYMYRPDSVDIDLYQFQLDSLGELTIETIAERLGVPSHLDTTIKLFHETVDENGNAIIVEVAQNDDYFSADSFVRVPIESTGKYFIGISATGNTNYDPSIPGTGFGGLSEGNYDLRIDFTPSSLSGITDTTGVALDGDSDGRPGGEFNFWFEPSDPNSTIYVDKTASGFGANGTVGNPFNQIDLAIDASNPGDTIRVIGNGGADGLVETQDDNLAYHIGFDSNGIELEDGSQLEIPKDRQLIIDAGTVIKMSRSRIGIGSVLPTVDLSNSSIQVLGTPTLIGENGLPARDSANRIIPGSVFITSLNDDSVGGGNAPAFTPAPIAGDWGGLDFHGDLDAADESRRNRELEGAFLNHVQYADIRYGGGAVSIGGQQVVISPVEMASTRPTIINSIIRDSADAAMAASPDTFAETRFTDPIFQEPNPFTPDFARVGPEIQGNTIIDNSINGLFIRLQTRSASTLQTITTTTRFDDSDITHVLTENLVIAGTPGGPVIQSTAPSSLLIRPAAVANGNVPIGTYVYRITNVNATGLESAASQPTISVTLDAVGGVELTDLPTVVSGNDFVSRRLYRAEVDATTGLPGQFLLVSSLNASSTTFIDQAAQGSIELAGDGAVLRSRLDGSLVIDPGTVLKLDGARIEARFGANLIAEGLPSLPVVFTSIEDQRYGAGGTFDTNDRGDFGELNPGDWGGVYIGHGSSASFDHAVITGGGGTTRIEGGFASFNALEVHQANLRLTNSTLEDNADGRANASGNREGRGDNSAGTVFVSASNPIVAGNDFVNSGSSAISFDVSSFNNTEVNDPGRATGLIDRIQLVGNTGPLIQNNSMTGNAINGLEVRGGQLTTAGVWDDVDIVHVVRETIEVPNQHIFGGLRLQSDARGSLVVKFEDSPGNPAGIVVGGTLLTAADALRDIPDRIGGALQIVGHPDFPVVLTTLADDTAGAGFTRDGIPAVDTNGDGITGVDLADQTTGFSVVQNAQIGPEVNRGTTIDNDISTTTPGYFETTIGDGNIVQNDLTTYETPAGQIRTNQSLIFNYSTYVIVGNTATELSQTTITQPATLIADDVVESRGTFQGPNGLVNWIAESRFINGVATLFSELQLESETGDLGDIRVVYYLDEDVGIATTDDFLAQVGTPGDADFRAFTLDGPDRVGFSQGGFYLEDGVNLTNATYTGWAADDFAALLGDIQAGNRAFTIPGDIDVAALPPGVDPDFGAINGPADVGTAFAWNTTPGSSTATVTGFLEFLARDPALVNEAVIEGGLWNGITVREGAHDRNVAVASEQEPLRTAFFGTNDIPSQSQFLGELATSELAGDENSRLGFIVNGSITTRDDVDVYSFIAESNTEVWFDIDKTGTQFDSVVELIDVNGNLLFASNDSITAETNPELALFVNDNISGLNPDAIQPLSVTPERFEAQEITIPASITADTGSLTLVVSGTQTPAIEVPVDVFLQDPALAFETALENQFPNELGDVTVSLLRRSEGDEFVLRILFDDDFFTGRQVPDINVTGVALDDPNTRISTERKLLDSQVQDNYTSNRRDAGMRLRLPGEAGTRNLYHVRVRSNNTAVPSTDPDIALDQLRSNVRGGLTQGRYELQVRIQEQDEVGGTQVRLSDIRYARTGLQIIGQPFHSPLTGEEYETTEANNVLAEAQPLGLFGQSNDDDVIAQINQAQQDVAAAQVALNNATTQQGIAAAQLDLLNATNELNSVRGLISPLQSDTLSKSFAGVIDFANDVDWYRFEVQYQNLTRDGADLYLSTIFDLDYASNFARADMGLYVFNAAGQLILVGGDSNIADDQPASLTTNDTGNLARGSAGNQDPYIGSAELLEGTYFVAVSAQPRVPLPLDQFFNANSANPLLRLEPVESVTRIAEDRIGSFGGGTASPPEVEFLFDENSSVPYTLNDVVLFVNTAGNVQAVNPFTGVQYDYSPSWPGAFGGATINDVAFASNGELFGYALPRGGGDADTTWTYERINPASSVSTTVGPTGVETRHWSGNVELNDMTGEIEEPPQLDEDSNVGVEVEAITLRSETDTGGGFFVGNRGDRGNQLGLNIAQTVITPSGSFTFGGAGYGENLLFQFNPRTGVVLDGGDTQAVPLTAVNGVPTNAAGLGGTEPGSLGRIDTTAPVGAQSGFLGVSGVTEINSNGLAVQALFDEDTFVLSNGVDAPVTFEFNQSFTLTATGTTVADAATFTVDGTVFEFNTGQSLQIEAVEPIGNLARGTTVEIVAPSGAAGRFEFLEPGDVAIGDNIGIDIIDAFGTPIDANLIAATLAGEINNELPELAAVAINDEIFFSAAQATSISTVGDGVNIVGDSSLLDPNAVEILVSPVIAQDAFIAAIDSAAAGQNIATSAVGNLVSFPSATVVDLPQSTASLTLSGDPALSDVNNQPIFFLPTDTVSVIAQRVEIAVQQANTDGLLTGVDAISRGSGHSLEISGGVVLQANGTGLTLGGVPNGGIIRGLELLNGTLFAVSDNGGLYTVAQGGNRDNLGNYVEESTDLRGLNFTGLRAGPNSVDGGAYQSILFGITGNGDIHAFNTLGELQPVFAGGRTSISTGIGGAEGLDFSNLDFSLWHQTTVRDTDLGHGINSLDNYRGATEGTFGNASLSFSYNPGIHNGNFAAGESPNARTRLDGQPVATTYNFPGGAKGVLNSNTFSLRGYSSNDRPTMYFNYFLGVEGGNNDRLRVYVVTEDGVEHIVASNSEIRRGGLSDDEFDDPNPLFFPAYDDDVDVKVQQLFDNTGWRQARVPLDDFAGEKNLSLRVEFSTSGVAAAGNSVSLRAPAGDVLVEGESIVINNESFAIDLSPAVRVPSGLELANFYASAPDVLASVVIDGQEYVFDDGTRTDDIDASQIAIDLVAFAPVGTPISSLPAQDIARALETTVSDNLPPAPTTASFDFSDRDDTAGLSGRNDLIFEATPLPYDSGSVTFTGTGFLGSNPDNGPVVNLDDVDLLRVNLQQDTTVNVNVELTNNPARQAAVRFFDSEGNELASGTLTDNGVTFTQYTATANETIFIGISDLDNQQYDIRFPDSGSIGIADEYNAIVRIEQRPSILFEGNLVEFTGAQTLTVSPTNLFTVSGTNPVLGNRIPVSRFDSAPAIALAAQLAIANRYADGELSRIPTSGPSIALPLLTVDDPGPFALESERYGDFFPSGVNPGSPPVADVAGAQNQFEGVYLDDFIIGFAERGERATRSNPVTGNFITDGLPSIPVPGDPVSSLQTGSYQVEIRDGTEYVASGLNQLISTIDTNDRLASGALTLVARSADEIQDGYVFSMFDGRSTIEFEFNIIETNSGVTPGRVEIPITLLAVEPGTEEIDPLTGEPIPGTGVIRPQNENEVAVAVVEAINRQEVQSIIQAPAVQSSGFDADFDARINVFGDVTIKDEVGAFDALELNNARGDQNRERDAQGVILVENSRFLFNEGFGVDINHDITASVNGVTTDSAIRYPRNLVELNTENLKPGVVVQSSVFAFNGTGGLQIAGIDTALDETGGDAIPFERIVNNTFIGGSISEGTQAPAATFNGILFPSGSISFADNIVDYDPSAGGSPPLFTFQDETQALGAPDGTGRGTEPVDGTTSVSLGLGGTLTVEFTNNLLSGSGDASPDLIVFEDGAVESVQVEISRDGVSFFDVGILGGLTNRLDIDAFGFGVQDRFAFVRLTDLRQGDTTIPQLGADIDAIGALSSAVVDDFTTGGIGINVVGGAAPTLLNNLISNTDNGISVDPANDGLVMGGNTFYRNTENVPAGVGLGEFPQVLSPSEVVFVGASDLVFAPAAGASIIDSSIDSLEDRASLTTVRNPLGIPPSPILAPRLDVNGQLRIDDPNVETPGGLGERVFKDRGASDRGDLDGPRAVLLQPRAPGLGVGAGAVPVFGEVPRFFEIQLVDGLEPADVVPGTGIDDTTVRSSSVLVLQNNVPLVEGIDYRFGYNPSTNIIRITPTAGVFEPDSTYVIRMIDATDAVVVASDGVTYNDGSVLNVLDVLGNPTSFEYETGIQLTISNSVIGSGADGFVIDLFDGNNLISLELDTDGIFDSLNAPVTIPLTANADQIAAIIADTINQSAALNFVAAASGNSVQVLGGTPLSSIVSSSGFITANGAIGTAPGFGIQVPAVGAAPADTILDGQSFIVRRGAVAEVTFELDNDGLLNDTTATPIVIPVNPTLDNIADALVRAIGGAGLGLDPSNAGFGRVVLGGDANYSLDLTTSVFQQIGLPGQVATIPIDIPVDQDATAIAQIIANTIDGANLPGVTTNPVDVRVFLEGTGGVNGTGASDLITIQDEVGNRLQSNQPNGRTELTIFIGGGSDFGDAPAPYVSLEVDNGPRHTVDEGFALGALVSADSDARLNNQDNDDGITFNGVLQTGFVDFIDVTVTNNDPNRQFLLDVWFDWNGDGVFSETERDRYISDNVDQMANGINLPVIGVGTGQIPADVPADAQVGNTYARFRLSELTSIGPGGELPVVGPLGDGGLGEVEDHRFLITNNEFQNPTNFTDVNASGFTSPIDALQIINAIDRAGGNINLDNPASFPAIMPEFPDVTGDGNVTALDALRVINRLQEIGRNGGEGELQQLFVPAASGVLASGATVIGDSLIAERAAAEGLQSDISEQTDTDNGKTSVFDAPAVVELDAVVDSLAEDTASARSETDDAEVALDQLFAQF